MIWSHIFGRRDETVPVDPVWPIAEAGKLARPAESAAAAPTPTTCAEAGRGGYIVRHDRERDKIRKATIALAEKIGRPELAEPLR